ncbi:hypothetical protein SAY87_015533 [Trapa incisa]|uniref:BZIP domain-containing protein n=1 Tax=Trapa incisa TaxID=236973 RepID=A0AAN7H3U6_9MYRT|nr:hypothetical protein SAY87_015533 [Trapa incisa]
MDDDGEVELSESVMLPPQPDSSTTSFTNSGSVDLFLDDLLKNTMTCTHRHTCNPPGPEASDHTHTCYHTHTRVLASDEDGTPLKRPVKRPSGNREAVRKYREKKKAHTAYLEEEVRKLRATNQQMARKLQGQSAMEAEILRLRGLLYDLKGKIDGELGGFPFYNNSSTDELKEAADCGLIRCNGLPCSFYPDVGLSSQAQAVVAWDAAENCHPPGADCGVKIDDDTVSPNGHSSTPVAPQSQAD